MPAHTQLAGSQGVTRPRALIVAAVVATMSMLVPGTIATASSRPAPEDGAGVVLQQQGSSAEPIPLADVADLTSIDATVVVSADGTVDGEPTQGDLTIDLSSNDQNMSRIDVRGSLLGDVVAQIGGKAVSLFRPKSASVYSVPEGTYAVVTGLFDVCAKLDDSAATEVLEQLSPQFLLSVLTSSDVAMGTFVGDETLDGMAVKRYLIDGESFIAAAQSSSDPVVSDFARSLQRAEDADLYVAADGGYPVSYRGGFGGAFEPLALEGELSIEVDVTGVDNDTPVTLPKSCDRPIAL